MGPKPSKMVGFHFFSFLVTTLTFWCDCFNILLLLSHQWPFKHVPVPKSVKICDFVSKWDIWGNMGKMCPKPPKMVEFHFFAFCLTVLCSASNESSMTLQACPSAKTCKKCDFGPKWDIWGIWAQPSKMVGFHFFSFVVTVLIFCF